MPAMSSIRTKFQAVVVALTLTAVGISGWIGSSSATAALRESTADRLRAVRETKQHALERYFEDLRRHVTALSTSEATIQALQGFEAAWALMPDAALEATAHRDLSRFYRETLAPRVADTIAPEAFVSVWFPRRGPAQALQYRFLVSNPHPMGAKDLLLEVPDQPAYSAVHAKHHPTFHRYQSAFGFYDIFLISATRGRILYSVMKEIDLGMALDDEPYRSTQLGRVYRRAMELDRTDETSAVLEDFAPYVASAFAPAAFIAAPVRRAGTLVGVLAMQLSIREVDRVMTGGQNWRGEGLGDTGQAYVVGADGTPRSDLRGQIEQPEAFLADLEAGGVAAAAIARVKRDQTTVLNLPMDLPATPAATGSGGIESGVNLRGDRVLRSRAPLQVPDVQWTVVAEIDAAEALAPVRALQTRLVTAGVILGAALFLVAGWLGASVTGPVLELARTVARLGSGDRGATVAVRSNDEVGQLAAAFNRMSRVLSETTVSKSELEVLAGRLITAQEDERRRVGRELHDDLVQRVAATAIEVGRLEQMPPGSVREEGLQALKHTLRTLSQDVHALSRRIHPATLEDRGLHASLEAECRAFTERGGPPVELRIRGPVDEIPADAMLGIYRIVQESLRNAWQHANATEVSIDVERAGGNATLTVADDGTGFDRSTPDWKAGLGLASMEERVRLLGGTLLVTSAPGRGTKVQVRIPLETTNAETPDPAG
jgi:signal transduction histidine kinase